MSLTLATTFFTLATMNAATISRQIPRETLEPVFREK
jgi:hypothetical protein